MFKYRQPNSFSTKLHVQSHFLTFFKMSSESCVWVIVYHIVEVFLWFGDKLGKIYQKMFASQELLLLSIYHQRCHLKTSAMKYYGDHSLCSLCKKNQLI